MNIMKQSIVILIAPLGIIVVIPLFIAITHRDSSTFIEDVSTAEESDESQPVFDPCDSVSLYMDVRGKDLRNCDLRYAGNILHTLRFNNETLWPATDRLPDGFDPNVLLQEGMNPGLCVRELHNQGITGKGVYVAIIDHPLFLTHPEYVGKIAAYYHDENCAAVGHSMHGHAVTSLLVGTHCGTAPEARVFYAAVPSWALDSADYAEAMEWIIDCNRGLPDSEKIRLVSASVSPSGQRSSFKKNKAQWDDAVRRAQKEGILVLDCTLHHGFISACWYDPNDRENPAGCTPGYPGMTDRYRQGNLMAPTSFRTVARHDMANHPSYQYLGRGGLSWSIPYVAGVLAMGWQIRPELSPEQMKNLLFQSAYRNEKGVRIIDPKAFIQRIKTIDSDSLKES